MCFIRPPILQLHIYRQSHSSRLLVPVATAPGADDISGRAFCKAYQHFCSWPSTGRRLLCFSSLFFTAVFPPFTLWYFPIFPPLGSRSIIYFPVCSSPRLFSCLPLSHGVSSSSPPYQPFIIFQALQIMQPPLNLLNDQKTPLPARHLTRFIFLASLSSSSGESLAKYLIAVSWISLEVARYHSGSVPAGYMKDNISYIYRCTFQNKKIQQSPCCSTQRQHSFETGAIRSDKAIGWLRGFP